MNVNEEDDWFWLKAIVNKGRHLFIYDNIIIIIMIDYDWKRLLIFEDNCKRIKTTVNERRRLLTKEDDFLWMKTAVIESRRLLINEDDCYWIKMTVND